MVEVNPGDPDPPDAETTPEELSKLHAVNSADSLERQKVGAELCTVKYLSHRLKYREEFGCVPIVVVL